MTQDQTSFSADRNSLPAVIGAEPTALMGIPISIPAVVAAPLHSSAAMRVMTSVELRGLLFHAKVWV